MKRAASEEPAEAPPQKRQEGDFFVEVDDDIPTFPANPAKQYPFPLDEFQSKSISILETGDSVMVSAHTSAGKTVVAEYAIAMCLRDGKRVIYTSPIKALSNQKYRDLSQEFEEVGLMTGDVTINPNADCLVMTTEILRSMLYRGNEMLREVGCCIFDEIHYMRDKSRGVVWEETIIMLPDKVQYVFLSATIPNAKEFTSWIEKIHPGQRCRVVHTNLRPTPLQHYMYPSGGDGIYLVVDDVGNFKEQNYAEVTKALGGSPEEKNIDGAKWKKTKAGYNNIFKLIKMIMDKGLAPAIVFSFSKRECESLALQLSKIDMCDESEKRLVTEVFQAAVDSLSEEDKKLPQVEHILPLLKRGIGIHHSGLLPILKEVVEILFQESLVKVLFSTETFSMGLNMPARTVIFTNARKFDGTQTRWLTSGEYIQMSGRAGRRGLDSFGLAITMLSEPVDSEIIKHMTSGRPDPLNSAFRLTFSMILNLLRVEEVNPEYIISRSFYQYQQTQQAPNLEKEVEELEALKAGITIAQEEEIAECVQMEIQHSKLKELIRKKMVQPTFVLNFLQPGRLIWMMEGEDDYDWGVVINFHKQQQIETLKEGNVEKFTVDVLVNCMDSVQQAVSGGKRPRPKPCPPDSVVRGEMKVVPFDLDAIQAVSKLRIFCPDDLKPKEARDGVWGNLNKVKAQFPQGLPQLDPIEEMKINDKEVRKSLRRVEALEQRLTKNIFHNPQSSEVAGRVARYKQKLEIENQINSLKTRIMEYTKNIVMKDELKAMMRALRRLGYTSEDDVIQKKGRVACEVNTADELLLTELIFGGLFNDMDPSKLVALMSCLVNEEPTPPDYQPKPEFRHALRTLFDTAKRVVQVSLESKINIEEEKELQKLSPSLLDATYAWAKGAKFSEVCAMTDAFEGSIIRMMRRLEELLRQLAGASKAVGDESLSQKFLDGIKLIKRDIVFAASLYL
eukprot:TRINITY_DN68_c0_g2_i1.p1 TRINITY_DN68_c0_g2~~TRINITY_DN68_c0_g2_i1.p1  ORF type:complete len:957 (-),score=200.80 TRINITY_DN68_c0_g2_i1:647-3517(-)